MTPYADLPEKAFWKSGVARADPMTIEGLYTRKFEIRPQDRIVTAGSCFAQHITGALRQNGYRIVDVEPGPPWLDKAALGAHGYGQFSARYGNVYTARQLLQLAREAFEGFEPSETAWMRKNRFYDAQRPGVDPNGMDTEEEVRAVRADHLAKLRQMFAEMNVFIFTLGLTEAWMDADGTTVFPTAPGVIAGQWDPEKYRFENFTQAQVVADVRAFLDLIRTHNKHVKVILTVSPVPLTATAAGGHVLSATTYSKSVLRAAAGELSGADDAIDYFPSYELIASPFSRGAFFEGNLRGVTGTGVQAVMRMFFAQHPPLGTSEDAALEEMDLNCEEELLEAFAR